MKGAPKIFVLEGDKAKEMFGYPKVLIGLAGPANDICSVNRFLYGGVKTLPRFRDSTFLMLCKEGLFDSTNFEDWVYIDAKAWSIGSGSDFALGALQHGASPKEAVLHASKFDVFTGYGVKEYSL
jgi:ATP-dependent protease HslVU (ClpYQ) peptidase subunit